MPWQDKDENDKLPVWRYKANPIIDRFATRNSNSIFNSAVVPFEDGYAGVFRCDSRSISMDIFAGFSKDGIHWDISDDPIVFHCDDEEIGKRDYRYDPRVCFIEDRYYITWCNGYHGYPTIGVVSIDLSRKKNSISVKWQKCIFQLIKCFKIKCITLSLIHI